MVLSIGNFPDFTSEIICGREIANLQRGGTGVRMGGGPRLDRRRGCADGGCTAADYSGEVLGVLAVFDRKRLSEEEFRWLRISADHAAVALANARASAQIEELRRKLEEENEIF